MPANTSNQTPQNVSLGYFLTRSLRLIGVGSPGAPPVSGTQLNDALYTFNEGLDSWNNDHGMIPAFNYLTFPVGGKQKYLIGPQSAAPVGVTVDLNVAVRPVGVTFASFTVLTANPSLDIPITILSAEEWQGIPVKGVQSTISYYLYIDQNYPIANVSLYPQPNMQANVVLVCPAIQPQEFGLNTQLQLPPGYAEALRLRTAIALAPEFGREPSPSIVSRYNELKTKISHTNIRSGRIRYSGEAQGTGVGSGTYDVLTDIIR